MFRKFGILVLSIIVFFFLSKPLKAFHVDLEKGGHNTLTTEGLNLKKDVHKNDADGGEKFNSWASDRTVIEGFRNGGHDEDSTKTKGYYIQSEEPTGPNGDGNFYEHYYDPDTGRGLDYLLLS